MRGSFGVEDVLKEESHFPPFELKMEDEMIVCYKIVKNWNKRLLSAFYDTSISDFTLGEWYSSPKNDWKKYGCHAFLRIDDAINAGWDFDCIIKSKVFSEDVLAFGDGGATIEAPALRAKSMYLGEIVYEK